MRISHRKRNQRKLTQIYSGFEWEKSLKIQLRLHGDFKFKIYNKIKGKGTNIDSPHSDAFLESTYYCTMSSLWIVKI
jgi:hypothetical protein